MPSVTQLNMPFPNARKADVARGHEYPHVTNIIYAIQNSMWPNKYKPESPETKQLRFAAGFTWEEVLTMAFGNRLAPRLPEQLCEGILLNPDGVWLANSGKGLIAEYKFTWRSSRHPIENNWYWMMQASAYCYLWGCNAALFYVYYVNGDYTTRQPEWNGGELITFEDKEIVMNWNTIKNNQYLVTGEDRNVIRTNKQA